MFEKFFLSLDMYWRQFEHYHNVNRYHIFFYKSRKISFWMDEFSSRESWLNWMYVINAHSLCFWVSYICRSVGPCRTYVGGGGLVARRTVLILPDMAYKKAQSRPNFRWPLCPNLRQPAAETFCVGSFKGQLSFQYQWLSNYGRFVEFWGLVLQNAILEKDLAPREIQIDYFLKDYKCFRPFENAFELGKVSSFWTCIPNLCILWRNFTHLCIYLVSYLTKCNVNGTLYLVADWIIGSPWLSRFWLP